MLSALPFALVSPLLGAAEGALADFIDMAKVRSTRGAVAGGNIAWRNLRQSKAAWLKLPDRSKLHA